MKNISTSFHAFHFYFPYIYISISDSKFVQLACLILFYPCCTFILYMSNKFFLRGVLLAVCAITSIFIGKIHVAIKENTRWKCSFENKIRRQRIYQETKIKLNFISSISFFVDSMASFTFFRSPSVFYILAFHTSDRKWQTVSITTISCKNQYSIDVYFNLFVHFFHPASVILWFVECINNWRGEYVSAHSKTLDVCIGNKCTQVRRQKKSTTNNHQLFEARSTTAFFLVSRERDKWWSAFGILYWVIIVAIMCFFAWCTWNGTWQ